MKKGSRGLSIFGHPKRRIRLAPPFFFEFVKRGYNAGAGCSVEPTTSARSSGQLASSHEVAGSSPDMTG
jgi:hypothetical protein